MASNYSSFDSSDDFTSWSFTGSSDLSKTRLAAPSVPYRGGAGLIDLVPSGNTNYTWTAKRSVTSGRAVRWTGAVRFEVFSIAADRTGPFSILTIDEASSSAASILTKSFGSEGGWFGLSTDSLGSIPVPAYPDDWCIFEFTGISRDRPGLTDTQPFDVQARMRFWLDRGTELKPLGVLKWDPDGLTDVWKFQQFFLGFASMNQVTDDFTIWVDEWFQETSNAGVPGVRLPLGRRFPWPTSL